MLIGCDLHHHADVAGELTQIFDAAYADAYRLWRRSRESSAAAEAMPQPLLAVALALFLGRCRISRTQRRRRRKRLNMCTWRCWFISR
jgi:hypothetical protein